MAAADVIERESADGDDAGPVHGAVRDVQHGERAVRLAALVGG